jgi:hypothetical protein
VSYIVPNSIFIKELAVIFSFRFRGVTMSDLALPLRAEMVEIHQPFIGRQISIIP